MERSFLQYASDEEEVSHSRLLFHPIKKVAQQPDQLSTLQDTLLQYNLRRIPRELVFSIQQSSLSSRHSCGLYNYVWLLCNAKTYVNNDFDVRLDPFRAIVEQPIDVLVQAFSSKTKKNCFAMLNHLQSINLIKYDYTKTTQIVKVFIRGCQRKKSLGNKILKFEKSAIKKHIGFVFLNSYEVESAFAQTATYSARDVLISLWIHSVYNDPKFPISKNTACVAWHTKYRFSVILKHNNLAKHWHCSTATATSMLCQIEKAGFISMQKLHSVGTFISINNYSEWLWNQPATAITAEDILIKVLKKDANPIIRKQKQKIASLSAIAHYYANIGRSDISATYKGKIYQEKFRLLGLQNKLIDISKHLSDLPAWIDNLLIFGNSGINNRVFSLHSKFHLRSD